MTKIEIQELVNEQQSIIADREAKLKATDYVALKIAEGKATKTQYADTLAQRQQWRDEINAAQVEIEHLQAMEPEEPEDREEVEA
jgi:uncharacterized protein (DUF1015 family)